MKNGIKKKLLSIAVAAALGFLAKKGVIKPDTSPKREVRASRAIVLTEHAKCRMKCRFITKDEIVETLASGILNTKKSNPAKKPCPVEALEHRVKKDNQLIRVVAGKCLKKTKIITVIDLERNYDCYCR